jgi:chromosome segregation ATPase
MSTLSDFFARKGVNLISEKSGSRLPGVELNGDANSDANRNDRPAAETWAEIGLRIGGDNEAVRSLMVDIGRRIDALDDLRDTFGKIVDPIDQALRTLEREKFDNVTLRNALGEVRTSYETLRAEFKELGRKVVESETETERLRYELGQAQQAVGALETSKIELTNELEPARVKLVDLEQQLARETAAARVLNDHTEMLSVRFAAADKRSAGLEGEIASAREAHVLHENENHSLQTSLDQIVGENSRLARRLTESEASLDKARLQLEQIKTALTAVEAERNKLTAAVDEANEKRHTETNTLSTRLEAMSSRATAAEKLLAELRQSLLARTEESSAAERKVADATVARNATDKKLELVQNSLQLKERQVQDVEQSRSKLVERTNTLVKTVKTLDSALARAEDRIKLLGERVAQLEAEAEANLAKSQESVDDLNSQLQCERMERTVAEGALKKARTSCAELQRELDDHVRHNVKLGDRAGDKVQVRSTPKDLAQEMKSRLPASTSLAPRRFPDVERPADEPAPDERS